MLKTLLRALCVLLAAASFNAQAVLISNATVIPDANILLNFNNSGLDWVYAGPIAPNEFAPGNIQPSSYRASEGWRAATEAEWAARPIWSDFIVSGNPGNILSPINGYSNHSAYLFASEYWGDFGHVDMNDFFEGRVTDGVNGVLSGVPETIYVRNSLVSNIPEPASLALLGLGLVGLVASRRRKTA